MAATEHIALRENIDRVSHATIFYSPHSMLMLVQLPNNVPFNDCQENNYIYMFTHACVRV